MVRLVLEENGERRAFRLGEGTLSIGSGPDARLRLASAGVAARHAELEARGGQVFLRALPGVVPPTVGGRPVAGEVLIAPGDSVAIGGARIWLEEEARAAAASAPAVPGARGAAGARPRSPAPRSRRPPGRDSSRARTGLPGWAVSLLVLGAVAVAAVFLIVSFEQGTKRGSGQASATIAAIRRLVDESALDRAEERLDLIADGRELSASERAEIAALRDEIAQGRAQADTDLENMRGTKWKNVYLERYEQSYLQTSPEPSKVRLFLKRCAEFRRRWPRHPELDWVARQESRFSGYVDPNAPPTWEDVEWEVGRLVLVMPRDYREAFRLLDDFAAMRGGEDAEKARAKRVELAGERDDYHIDRLQQARYEFEKRRDPSAAVWWLVHSIIWLGDPALADEAARFLVRMPDLDEHLRGYETEYPDKHAALLQNPIVKAWAAEHP